MYGIAIRLRRGKHHQHRLRLRLRLRRTAPGAVAALAVAAAGMVAAAGPAMAADSATATVNGATTFQAITGFGASEAFGEAATVMGAPSPVQQALNDLYGPSGASLTILRNGISADSGGTIEPNAPSSPSATPAYLPLSSIRTWGSSGSRSRSRRTTGSRTSSPTHGARRRS
ncbi:MAG TPA: hypothetical protein VGI74_02475 [Streptosporangiaceae bacterium]